MTVSADKASEGVPNDPMRDEYTYWCFISYSHSDDQWAKWIHRAIETYRVPRHLWGRPSAFGPLPRRLFPVFRDREELPCATDLGAKLHNVLRGSRNLLVICSARAAVSRWVNEEIRTFKSWKREERVFAIIVDGEPNATDNPDCGQLECFPAALRYRLADDGEISGEPTAIIAADARPGKDGKSAALLKLLSGVLGVPFDDLKQRERARLRWKRIRMAALGVPIMGAGQGHTASSVLQAPDAKREDRLDAARMLSAVFQDRPAIEDSGEKLGWRSHYGDVDTIAVTSLWMSIGYATLLQHGNLLTDDEMQDAREQFFYVQEVLETYRHESGGWNMFPRQKDPALHSVYSSALALLALLETRRAGLPWNGSIETRDKLLTATAHWLCGKHDMPLGNMPGWRGNPVGYEVSDGLTLQI